MKFKTSFKEGFHQKYIIDDKLSVFIFPAAFVNQVFHIPLSGIQGSLY
jgi:hypothetical protein